MAAFDTAASTAMLDTIEQVKNVIDYRVQSYKEGKYIKDNQTVYLDSEEKKIEALQSICDGVIMLCSHIKDKMPELKFVTDEEGTVWEEKTYLKKVKSDWKKNGERF